MTFGQQVLASFIGTTFGFAFAILLFLITNAIRGVSQRKTLFKHVKREFEYDISLLQEWIEEMEKILRKITANDSNVFSYLRYTFFQRAFMQEGFRTGMMYNALGNEDISNLNTVLLHCDFGTEQYVNSFIQQWKTGQLGEQDALQKFEFEKEELGRHRKRLQQILQELEK